MYSESVVLHVGALDQVVDDILVMEIMRCCILSESKSPVKDRQTREWQTQEWQTWEWQTQGCWATERGLRGLISKLKGDYAGRG